MAKPQVQSRTVTLSPFGQHREQAYSFAWSLVSSGEYAVVVRVNGAYFVEHEESIH